MIFEFAKQFSSGDLRTVFHVSHGRINKMQKWMFTLQRSFVIPFIFARTSFDQDMCLVHQERVLFQGSSELVPQSF